MRYCFGAKIFLSQGISRPSRNALSAFDCCTKTGLMEKASVEKSEAKFVRKRSGKPFKSREHGKQEKRKQRKAWRKRKREAKRGNPEQQPRAEDVPLQDVEAPEISAAKPEEETNEQRFSRGKKLVELAKKRKREDEVLKPVTAKLSRKNDTKETKKLHSFKELDRDLLVIDESEVVGSGTFGSCFSAVYRGNFRVIVKAMNTRDSSSKEMERAKQEVVHEAEVIANLGDHPSIPHLFGVCIDRAPFYLVLQQHAVKGVSLTLSKALTNGVIDGNSECLKVVKGTCEALLYVHRQGYLHNDLKGNNVVLEGTDHRPVLIDFGKSRKIKKARLLKPKPDPAEAARRYPHIAPELHRGERQTTSSDVYSFGVLVSRVLRDGKFHIPALKRIAKNCVTTNPGKRPKLDEVLREITNIALN